MFGICTPGFFDVTCIWSSQMVLSASGPALFLSFISSPSSFCVFITSAFVTNTAGVSFSRYKRMRSLYDVFATVVTFSDYEALSLLDLLANGCLTRRVFKVKWAKPRSVHTVPFVPVLSTASWGIWAIRQLRRPTRPTGILSPVVSGSGGSNHADSQYLNSISLRSYCFVSYLKV